MKFRTDFVTNSSSSSFVLVVRIGLKNGKVLEFQGRSGVGEYGDDEYYQLTADKSPKELGRSKSIEELIDMLQASIVEDGVWRDNPRPALTGKHPIIKELKKLSSMDEIEKITINGEEHGRNELQYKYYTYYRDMGVMFAVEGGDEEIHAEGTGGAIKFYNSGMRGLHHGGASSSIYSDVEPDMKQLELLQNTYVELCNQYLERIQKLSYDDEIIFFAKKFLLQSFEYMKLPDGIIVLGGRRYYNVENPDYLVVEDQIPSLKDIFPDELEALNEKIRGFLRIIDASLSNETEKGKIRYLKKSHLFEVINAETANGYPYFTKTIEEWKKRIPFDHISEIECIRKNFAFVGLANEAMEKYLKINYPQSVFSLKEWIAKLGGVCKSSVTRNCDYVICGLHAETCQAYQIALRFRDSGKSQLKIIAEDEMLRLLSGEKLELTQYDLNAMEARKAKLLAQQKEAQQRLKYEQEMKEKERMRIQEEKRRDKEEREQRLKYEQEMKEKEREERENERKRMQALAAEEAAEKERQRQESIANVLYKPGNEPENIRRRINVLFPKLDAAYPNKQIIALNKEHKKWGETVTELYRLLGYPDGRAFLEAYGYTVVDNKGGRPSNNNYDEVILELHRRYPNGFGLKSVQALKEANPDLPIKSLANYSKTLYGMPLGEYLKQEGILV